MGYSLNGGGKNENGILARARYAKISSPAQTIAGGISWSQVSGGYYYAAAIKTDGTLWTWGRNDYGQLGTNNTSIYDSPVQTIAGGTNWSQVAVCGTYSYHTAAIKKDGTLWTWGYNGYGQLGDETTIHRSSPVQTIAGGTNWSSVAVGYNHTAAIKTDGTLWTWGYNYGQLGDDTTISKSSPVQTITYGTNWSQVSCGYHTTAIKTDGTLWTWGYNSYGQLGDATNTSKSSPVQTITGGTDWSSASCSAYNTAAIKTDGSLWLWGYNYAGQLGDDTNTNKNSPVQTVTGGTNWSQVSCGYYTSAIKTDGTLWTWGWNDWGALGDNTIVRKSSPVQTITYGTNWSQVSSGYVAAAIKKDGTLWTWGNNTYGELGDGSIFINLQNINFGNNISKISASKTYFYTTSHAAIIKTDGTLWTWGWNDYGQLGDDTTTNRSSPVQTITYGTDWNYVFCGSFVTAAIKTDGTLWMWGANFNGELGDDTNTFKSSPVQTISGGTNWSSVSVSGAHTAAIKTDGTLWVWGQNQAGQLGDETTIHRSSPVQTIAGGTNWSQVSCGSFHTAAIKTDGTLWTWGYNYDGQLGDNTLTFKSSPVQTITYGTDWSQVNCGLFHTTAIKTDGTLWMWGANFNGELGDNTTTGKSSPVQTITYGTNWSQVSCGYRHTAAIKTDGTLWAWGHNSDNQLSDGTRTNRSSPVQINTLLKSWYAVASFTTGIFALILPENLVYLPIIPKKSEVSGNVPTSGQLNIGELAVNIADKKGYVKKSDGTVLNIFNGAVYDGGTF